MMDLVIYWMKVYAGPYDLFFWFGLAAAILTVAIAAERWTDENYSDEDDDEDDF